MALLQSSVVGTGVGSGVSYGVSIQLSSSRSKTWTATFTPLATATSASQADITWERGREGGAGKKPTGWESDLPRASHCWWQVFLHRSRVGCAEPRRTWLVRAELVFLRGQQGGGNSPGWGPVGGQGLSDSDMRAFTFPFASWCIPGPRGCVRFIEEMHSWWLHLQS